MEFRCATRAFACWAVLLACQRATFATNGPDVLAVVRQAQARGGPDVAAGLRAEVVTAKFSTVLGPADVEFGRGYSWGGGFQVGLHYQALDNLAFGLAYRSPTWFGDLAGGDADASLLGFLPIHLGTGSL